MGVLGQMNATREAQEQRRDKGGEEKWKGVEILLECGE